VPSQPFRETRSTGTGGGLWRGFVLLLVVLASVRADATANAAPIPGEKSTWNGHDPNQPTRGGWRKHPGNPVLGGDLGTCFDVAVLHEDDQYSMYFSWRPKSAIARVTSKDGVRWSEPILVLGPSDSGWEGRVNRPAVLRRNGVVHLWYTGQTKTRSFIGYATSNDGVHFKRIGNQPVLSPDQPWEKVAVMCPHVIWDDQAGRYRMWYSGGEQYEPDAIGYATSRDGVHWEKHAQNPVFRADPEADWERAKVTGCQVIRQGDWHLMFYIGFADEHTARIGLARSRDGITGWQRHPANPLISPTTGQWDGDACYKPFALFDRDRWLLWYNGRRGGSEQIGLAIHEGQDLGWESAERVPPASSKAILKPEAFKHYVDRFNALDEELYSQHVPNEAAWDFLRENVPLFECPDEDLEEVCLFRWWTYRKHIKKTPDGFVITEFLPDVPWSGKHNTISCPAGHHFYEGRWLHDPRYLDDYAVFWFRKGGEPRRYSFWAADAIWARYLVTGDRRLCIDLLDDLVANYEAWEKGFLWSRHRIGLRDNGLFFTIDDRDGGEMSIGGHGFRPTLNSYMYGDAMAIAKIARLAGRSQIAQRFEAKAARIKHLVQERLWDDKARFFKVLPEEPGARLVDVRELHGYTPWYFNLPDAGSGYETAWKQLIDPRGFLAPYGPTTAEQRHPGFRISYEGHECQWNGPSWPYATSITLTAMANLLNNYRQDVVGKRDYFHTLKTYARSHRLKREDGTVVPWIDENLNPYTGDWIARTRLKTGRDPPYHSQVRRHW